MANLGTSKIFGDLTVTGNTYLRGILNTDELHASSITEGGVLLSDKYLGIDDNAVSASKLASPVNINGVTFDGTSDITITADPNTHNHDDVYTRKEFGFGVSSNRIAQREGYTSFNDFTTSSISEIHSGDGLTDGPGTDTPGALLTLLSHNTSTAQILIKRGDSEMWFRDNYNVFRSWNRVWHSGNFDPADGSTHNHDSQYLGLYGGTLTGNLAVGALDRAEDSVIRAIAGDLNNAGFEAYGSDQGTGYLYVGRSPTYGGGIFYNGDGDPDFAAGEVNDTVSFFRRGSGSDEVVFYYLYDSNKVTFRGGLQVLDLDSENIVETDSTQNLISVAKGTAYNKNFGTESGTVAEGNHELTTHPDWGTYFDQAVKSTSDVTFKDITSTALFISGSTTARQFTETHQYRTDMAAFRQHQRRWAFRDMYNIEYYDATAEAWVTYDTDDWKTVLLGEIDGHWVIPEDKNNFRFSMENDTYQRGLMQIKFSTYAGLSPELQITVESSDDDDTWTFDSQHTVPYGHTHCLLMLAYNEGRSRRRFTFQVMNADGEKRIQIHNIDFYALNCGYNSYPFSWSHDKSLTLHGNLNITNPINYGTYGEFIKVVNSGLRSNDAWMRIGNDDYDWQIKYVGSTSGTGGNEFRVESAKTGKYIQLDHDGNFEYYSGSSTYDVLTSADITATDTSNWDTAYSQTHTHSNKSYLDDINQNLSKSADPQFKELYVTRSGNTSQEYLHTYVEDTVCTQKYNNDEDSASLKWIIENTDTENSDGTDSNTTELNFYATKSVYRLTFKRDGVSHDFWHEGNFNPDDYSKITDLTSSYIPYWDGSELINGPIRTDGTNVGIGYTPNSDARIACNGSAYFQRYTSYNHSADIFLQAGANNESSVKTGFPYKWRSRVGGNASGQNYHIEMRRKGETSWETHTTFSRDGVGINTDPVSGVALTVRGSNGEHTARFYVNGDERVTFEKSNEHASLFCYNEQAEDYTPFCIGGHSSQLSLAIEPENKTAGLFTDPVSGVALKVGGIGRYESNNFALLDLYRKNGGETNAAGLTFSTQNSDNERTEAIKIMGGLSNPTAGSESGYGYWDVLDDNGAFNRVLKITPSGAGINTDPVSGLALKVGGGALVESNGNTYVGVNTTSTGLSLSGLHLQYQDEDKWVIANRSADSNRLYISASPVNTNGTEVADTAAIHVDQDKKTKFYSSVGIDIDPISEAALVVSNKNSSHVARFYYTDTERLTFTNGALYNYDEDSGATYVSLSLGHHEAQYALNISPLDKSAGLFTDPVSGVALAVSGEISEDGSLLSDKYAPYHIHDNQNHLDSINQNLSTGASVRFKHYQISRTVSYQGNEDQVWLLCKNDGGNNEVIGTLWGQRSTGYFGSAKIDIQISSENSDGSDIHGFIKVSQIIGGSESYSLITCTYDGKSYIALRSDGNAYLFSELYFNGMIKSDYPNDIFRSLPISDVSDVSDFSNDHTKEMISASGFFADKIYENGTALDEKYAPKSASHTHNNKSYLDNIDQHLSTANSPVFKKISLVQDSYDHLVFERNGSYDGKYSITMPHGQFTIALNSGTSSHDRVFVLDQSGNLALGYSSQTEDFDHRLNVNGTAHISSSLTVGGSYLRVRNDIAANVSLHNNSTTTVRDNDIMSWNMDSNDESKLFSEISMHTDNDYTDGKIDIRVRKGSIDSLVTKCTFDLDGINVHGSLRINNNEISDSFIKKSGLTGIFRTFDSNPSWPTSGKSLEMFFYNNDGHIESCTRDGSSQTFHDIMYRASNHEFTDGKVVAWEGVRIGPSTAPILVNTHTISGTLGPSFRWADLPSGFTTTNTHVLSVRAKQVGPTDYYSLNPEDVEVIVRPGKIGYRCPDANHGDVEIIIVRVE